MNVVTTGVRVFTHKGILGGEEVLFEAATMTAVLDDLVARHPGQGTPTVLELEVDRLAASLADAEQEPNDVGHAGGCDCPTCLPEEHDPVERALKRGEKAVSEFGPGRQVLDEQARTRIESLQGELRKAGVAVDAGRQLYATGTRMARVGYETQADRKVEHDQKLPLHDAAHGLISQVLSERREDIVVTAREFASSLKVNGKVTSHGLSLSEQAIRGLLGRIESPALSYVLGIRDRIAGRVVLMRSIEVPDQRATCAAENAADKRQLAEVLEHECRRNPDVELKLRTRRCVGDVFAVVSPSYAVADAPEVLSQILDGLPRDARGSYSYDAASTSWELRASVWTPTPVEEQAVGEPFEGYVSFAARDNGTARLRGGGGVTMLACLNAGTYTAAGSDVSRVHRGKILVDVGAMLDGGLKAIHALCAAWGTAREEVVPVPEALTGVPISQLIPGFWWGEFGNRKSELAGVLPGRTSEHVRGLTEAYAAERRDPERLVRADMAQAWTRYIQGQPAPVRRDAEAAVGSWLVSGRPVRFEHRD